MQPGATSRTTCLSEGCELGGAPKVELVRDLTDIGAPAYVYSAPIPMFTDADRYPVTIKTIGSRMRRHPLVCAVIGYVLVLLVWFTPLLFGEQMGEAHVLNNFYPWLAEQPASYDDHAHPLEGDVGRVMYPALKLAGEQVRSGELPIWNDQQAGGVHLLGDMQAAAAFPVSWLSYVTSYEDAWGPSRALMLLIAGFGTFLFCRRIGISSLSSWLGGLVFMLSTPLIVWIQFPHGTVFTLLPWLMLAAEGLADRPDRRRLAAVAVVVAMSLLAGQPEIALKSTILVSVYLLIRLHQLGRLQIRSVAAWIAGHLLGVAIAAVAVLPFIDAYSHSVTRFSHGSRELFIPLSDLILLVVPGLEGFANPNFYGPEQTYLLVAAYAGLAALVLATVAFVRTRGRGKALAIAVPTALAALAATGAPPISWILENVPPFSLAVLGRGNHMIAFGVAVGAAAGIDSIGSRALVPAKLLKAMTILVAVVAVVAVVERVGGSLDAPRKTLIVGLGAFLLMAVLTTGLLTAGGRIPRRALFTLAALVFMIDASPWRTYNAIDPPAIAFGLRCQRALNLCRGRFPFLHQYLVELWRIGRLVRALGAFF